MARSNHYAVSRMQECGFNCLLPTTYWVLVYVCLLLISCSQQDAKLQQYNVQGEELYIKHCSNCHQKDGKGLGLVYPPVDVSDYIDLNLNKVICLIDNGIKDQLLVNGKSFNKPMPGVPQLTDLEIAEITTYLYNNWGRSKGLIDVKDVTAALQDCQ